MANRYKLQDSLHEDTNALIEKYIRLLTRACDDKIEDVDLCWLNDNIKYIVYRAFTDGRADFHHNGTRSEGVVDPLEYQGLYDLTAEETIVIKMTTPKPPAHIALLTKAIARVPTKRAKKK